ncbi:MAG: hypothetical protein JW759_02615 [Candidatus Coatesbacteria bacterium]|nr:hypothetical protein [Candidatus Coatesbacteria bacterium]
MDLIEVIPGGVRSPMSHAEQGFRENAFTICVGIGPRERVFVGDSPGQSWTRRHLANSALSTP